MPHVPRRLSPTTSMPPELLSEPAVERTAIPLTEPGEEASAKRLAIHGSKLSIYKHSVDPKNIYRILFGKEPKIDPGTRQLVHEPAANAVRVAVGA